MEREIYMMFPDKTVHQVVVYQANITQDGKVVISYYDMTEGMQDSFSEIINIDGVMTKKENSLEWNDYVKQFKPFSKNMSDRMVISFPEVIGLYNEKLQEVELPSKDEIDRLKNNSLTIQDLDSSYKPLNVVLFANQGETTVNLKLAKENNNLREYDLYAGSAFLEKSKDEMLELEETYYRSNISKQDKREIIYLIKYAFGSKFDIETLPVINYKTASGNNYSLSFSSCSSRSLFLQVKLADSLIVNNDFETSRHYRSNLSSALHYEKPLEIKTGGNIKTNSRHM